MTGTERAYAETGNFGLYYQAACCGGGNYACRAREVAINEGLLSGITNTRLGSSVLNNVKGKDCPAANAEMNEKMERIRRGLPLAHIAVLDAAGGSPANPVMLSRQDIADYRTRVLLENGGGDVFGGATWDKYMGWTGGRC